MSNTAFFYIKQLVENFCSLIILKKKQSGNPKSDMDESCNNYFKT